MKRLYYNIIRLSMAFGEFLFIYIICKKRRADFRQKCYSLPRWAYSRVALAPRSTALSLITGRRRSVAVPRQSSLLQWEKVSRNATDEVLHSMFIEYLRWRNLTPHQSPEVTASPTGEAFIAFRILFAEPYRPTSIILHLSFITTFYQI